MNNNWRKTKTQKAIHPFLVSDKLSFVTTVPETYYLKVCRIIFFTK